MLANEKKQNENQTQKSENEKLQQSKNVELEQNELKVDTKRPKKPNETIDIPTKG